MLGPRFRRLAWKEKREEEVESTLDRLHSQYGVHPCGEGGEYETFVLDCPLFHKRILIEESEVGV
ncbi:hypothetical protein ANCDUO_17730 [Ancylostoma duodenale]|uniref:Diphthamide synthase domain-containing protein n=1 Tax=Ancylostoma duodenale TaxID=51022 RepID=A0A0C2FU78_9BILA|nr:hypothetical protein ANCDUO_17730 [Ancylostoma duodenale]